MTLASAFLASKDARVGHSDGTPDLRDGGKIGRAPRTRIILKPIRDTGAFEVVGFIAASTPVLPAPPGPFARFISALFPPRQPR